MKKVICIISLVILFVSTTVSNAEVTSDQVVKVWNEVVKITGIDQLPLNIAGDRVPNAWVTYGNSVTVTTGLMRILHTEDEIFGVLAHEAGHVKLNNYSHMVTTSVSINILGLIAGRALNNTELGQLAGDVIIDVGTGLAAGGFSREREVEADDFAVDTAFAAYKDPSGIYTSLKRMYLVSGKNQPSGFNSHPPDDRRLLHIEKRIHKSDPNVIIPEVN
jgi:putative metalloprotease